LVRIDRHREQNARRWNLFGSVQSACQKGKSASNAKTLVQRQPLRIRRNTTMADGYPRGWALPWSGLAPGAVLFCPR
jgi:hypothetical protein